MSDRQQPGFTIVELLIVIVVIAVLAGISIVAYTGIQQRAKVSAHVAEMSQLQKAIQIGALEAGGESITVKPPVFHTTSIGTSELPVPIESVQELSLYVVFNTSNTPSNSWAAVARLQPHLDASTGFAVRASNPGTYTMHGFYATSAQANRAISYPNVLNTTGRHVGWITAKPGTVTSGFDSITGTTDVLSTHTGWNFTQLALLNSAMISGVYTVVFPEFHNDVTRAGVLGWLDSVYAVDYF